MLATALLPLALSSRGVVVPTSSRPAATTLSSRAIHRHATELQNRGFTVIEDVGLASCVAAAREACMEEFENLQDVVAQLGIEPNRQNYIFAEIGTRHEHRFDFRPTKASAWTKLIEAAVTAASPVVEHVHTELDPHPDDSLPVGLMTRHLAPAKPQIDQMGAILSRPGAAAQRFHCDAGDETIKWARLCPRHRLYNCFIPLVDIPPDSDGTLFWPGSHLERFREEGYLAAVRRSARREDGSQGHLEDDVDAMRQMVAPGCPAGGVILFDYRTLHRGLPNPDRDRAVAYAVLSTGYASDKVNFDEETSLFERLSMLPEEGSEEREDAREEIGSMLLDWEELYEKMEDEAEIFCEPRERWEKKIEEVRSSQAEEEVRSDTT